MLERILEPEVMDTAEEAREYDSMDHSAVNALFATELLAALDQLPQRSDGPLQMLDVGTGTAQIPIEIVRRRPGLKIVAIDLSAQMLHLARSNISGAGQGDSIQVQLVDAKSLPFPNGEFDVVISNSIIHHIPEPRSCLREMLRVLKPGGVMFVRDLLRPADLGTLTTLVEMHASGANVRQRQLFADSLHAALTVTEIQTLLEELGHPGEWVRQTSDRHWTIRGRLD